MTTIHRIQGGEDCRGLDLVELLGLFQKLGALPPTKDFLAEFARRDWYNLVFAVMLSQRY